MHGSTEHHENSRRRGSAVTADEHRTVLWMIERDPALRSTIIGGRGARRPRRLRPTSRTDPAGDKVFPRLSQRVSRTRRGVSTWADPRPGSRPAPHASPTCPPPGHAPATGRRRRTGRRGVRPARPLWHLTLFDGVEGGRSGLVIKMHHAMTDGVGGIGLMRLFTDAEPQPQQFPTRQSSPGQDRSPLRPERAGRAQLRPCGRPSATHSGRWNPPRTQPNQQSNSWRRQRIR